ncbi:hypothetical protein E2C01_006138 [Portunus trituberculatus]|uniref:Uncharacterized protein n=1 Tax=Portunus trituberculatus TaxID=210409 RepID=A0A5B7CWA3_PORTR|nr:hypothetical protein [Portunus trituberculatus]
MGRNSIDLAISAPFSHFSIGVHFYLEICVQLEYFIDIRKGLWRSKD